MKVRITGNCMISGNAYEENSVADLDKDVALEMITIGRAIPVESDRSVGLKKSDAPTRKTREKKD